MPEQTKMQIKYIDNNFALPVWVLQYGYQKCDSLHSFGPAIRDHYLLHFIVSGKGTYRKENKEASINTANYEHVTPTILSSESSAKLAHGQTVYHLSQGDGFFIAPNNITVYTADEETPWEYYWIGINGAYAKSLLKKAGISKDNPCFKFEINDTFFSIFESFIKNPKTGYPRDLDVLGDFYKLLSNIANVENKNNPTLPSPQIYLESAVEYIRNNYAYNITVSKIASFIGIDRTYLYKIFVSNLSMSVEKYIIETRLENAQNLLTTTNYTILQIALSTGFNDVSHFSNSFKRKFGCPPTEYRKKKFI